MKINKTAAKSSGSPMSSRLGDDSQHGKGIKKDRSSKRRLSIYDDFDDEEDNQYMDEDADFDLADDLYDEE